MFTWALIVGGAWFGIVFLFVVSLCLAAKRKPADAMLETYQLKVEEEILSEPAHSSLPPVIAVVESPEPVGSH